MLDLESPPLRSVRTVHQEKKLRKRRELDALVREGGSRRRKTGGREELLYRDEESSSEDSGPGRIEDGGGGVTVWRPSQHTRRRRRGVLWLGVRWGLAMGLVIFMGSVTVWLHVHTRTEIELVRRQLARGNSVISEIRLRVSSLQCRISTRPSRTPCTRYRGGWSWSRPTSHKSCSASQTFSTRSQSWRRGYR